MPPRRPFIASGSFHNFSHTSCLSGLVSIYTNGGNFQNNLVHPRELNKKNRSNKEHSFSRMHNRLLQSAMPSGGPAGESPFDDDHRTRVVKKSLAVL